MDKEDTSTTLSRNLNRSKQSSSSNFLIVDNRKNCLPIKVNSVSNYIEKRRLVIDTPFSNRSVISYGLIVYAKNTQTWALIQRKHSAEFLLYMRGLYRVTCLPLILSSIIKEEGDTIIECITDIDTFKRVYLEELELPLEGLDYALSRLQESRNITLELLSNRNLDNNSLKWTWPKGRLHYSNEKEIPFNCAKREFKEEVEIDLPPPLYISDTYVSETMRTIAGRDIESRYWIYIISEEIPMTIPKDHPEVSNRLWVSTEICNKLLRDNELFRQVVNMVNLI